jgi:hypothetical protein
MIKKYKFILSLLVILMLVVVSWLAMVKFDYKAIEKAIYSQNNSSSSCINCHGAMDGLSPLHAQLECISCHKGSNLVADKDSSHIGLIKIPGNLVDAPVTCGICHAEALNNITKSLMTTNSGIIAVDKYIFGEFDSPNIATHIKDIHHSPVDEHLRALCARCHLGADKTVYGSIDELSRGGGCNACHLNYSDKAKTQLVSYLEENELPSIHPSLDLQISDDHCFGCHSRSGRISANYQGYHETLLKAPEVDNWEGFRELQDERVFKYIQQDIHHERGLACIDCHGYEDVMGDGKTYFHEEDAVKISCEDCHTASFKNTASLAELSFVQQRIFKIRGFKHNEQAILLTNKDSVAIVNAFVDNDGAGHLISKLSQHEFTLTSPAASCTRVFGHQDLTCTSCHTSWAPQCIGCHVSYEPDTKGYDLLDKKEMQGSWVEYAGSFLSGPPTLGVRDNSSGQQVEPAIPGMIMTIDRSSFISHAMPDDTSFYRLFAPASPHTVASEGRTCTSCHNNPLALGYGRGELKFNPANGNWKFTPEYETLSHDNLPADAWIGFLKEPKEKSSTRLDFRPFSVSEQEKILTVGACLTCHDNESKVMRASLNSDFNNYLKTITRQCKLPEFN